MIVRLTISNMGDQGSNFRKNKKFQYVGGLELVGSLDSRCMALYKNGLKVIILTKRFSKGEKNSYLYARLLFYFGWGIVDSKVIHVDYSVFPHPKKIAIIVCIYHFITKRYTRIYIVGEKGIILS